MPISNLSSSSSGSVPVKYFDDAEALTTGEADFAGQLLTTQDGDSLAVASGTAVGETRGALRLLNSPIYTSAGVCIGTDTVQAGYALTVENAQGIYLRGASLVIDDVETNAPVIAGVQKLVLQATSSNSSLTIGDGDGGRNLYHTLGGVLSAGAGHSFSTGDPAAIRFEIADDAVQTHVPLRLASCLLEDVPSAAGQIGGLIWVVYPGGDPEVAYSDGYNWRVLRTKELI